MSTSAVSIQITIYHNRFYHIITKFQFSDFFFNENLNVYSVSNLGYYFKILKIYSQPFLTLFPENITMILLHCHYNILPIIMICFTWLSTVQRYSCYRWKWCRTKKNHSITAIRTLKDLARKGKFYLLNVNDTVS